MVHRLKVAIDPLLMERHGAEICWTWRLLLSGIGFPWEEVPWESSECDIAYVIEPSRAPRCRVSILADPKSWARPGRRLKGVGHCDGWSHPIYWGESQSLRPCEAVDGRLVYGRDVIFDVFWLATGQEERYWLRDKHGHFDLEGTVVHREQALRLGLASSIGSGLERALETLGLRAPFPRWPDGKRAAACVGHDVDYPEVAKWLEPLRILHRQGRNGLAAAASMLIGRRDHWKFSPWVQMEQGFATHSAFYFAARQGSLLEYASGTPDPFYDVRSERFRELFRFLVEEGFEIGLHASYRAFESVERFAAEKRLLEEACGQSVAGNRHHYWHLDPENPESTLLIHEKIGLKYDTSLTHERYLGWRRGLSWPFFPFHQKERRELRTLQISTAWMDDQLFKHRQDNPGERCTILRTLADRTAEQGGCLVMDVHEYVFDEVLYPGWARTYQDLLDYLIARSDFWIDTPGRITTHWIDRHASITSASTGLTGATDLAERGLACQRVSANALIAPIQLREETRMSHTASGGPSDGNGSARKPIASLSLDLDNKWSYMKIHGDAGWETFPSYLDVLVPRVLDFLATRHLRLTVFIVGQDAALEENRELLHSIASAGHEIGNHSFKHEPWLHLYSEKEIETEIALAEESIERATGQEPMGFRGPGYSLTRATLHELKRRGYRYDATTLPTVITPLGKAYYFMTAKLSPEERRRLRLFGGLRDGLRPIRPYRWHVGTGRLMEIPVTTMPFFRVPIHVSYILWLSTFSPAFALEYFKFALRLCRWTRTSPSLLLHPLDFLGCEDTSGLSFFPAMRLPREKKLQVVNDVLHLFSSQFSVLTMRQHALEAAQLQHLRVVEPHLPGHRVASDTSSDQPSHKGSF